LAQKDITTGCELTSRSSDTADTTLPGNHPVPALQLHGLTSQPPQAESQQRMSVPSSKGSTPAKVSEITVEQVAPVQQLTFSTMYSPEIKKKSSKVPSLTTVLEADEDLICHGAHDSPFAKENDLSPTDQGVSVCTKQLKKENSLPRPRIIPPLNLHKLQPPHQQRRRSTLYSPPSNPKEALKMRIQQTEVNFQPVCKRIPRPRPVSIPPLQLHKLPFQDTAQWQSLENAFISCEAATQFEPLQNSELSKAQRFQVPTNFYQSFWSLPLHFYKFARITDQRYEQSVVHVPGQSKNQLPALPEMIVHGVGLSREFSLSATEGNEDEVD